MCSEAVVTVSKILERDFNVLGNIRLDRAIF
jgi:hypothetical protein